MDAETYIETDRGLPVCLPSPEEASKHSAVLLAAAISDIAHSVRGVEVHHVAWYYERRAMAHNGTLYAMRRMGCTGVHMELAESNMRLLLAHVAECKLTGGQG